MAADPADLSTRNGIVRETDRSVSVDASAGTGKTELMTRRVVSLARRGGDITSIAVLTFGEAAADEIRRRIRASIREMEDGPVRRRLLLELPSAYITTIHSFASSMLREYSHLTGVDPAFEVAEQPFSRPALQKLWEEHLEEDPLRTLRCRGILERSAALPEVALRLASRGFTDPGAFLPGGSHAEIISASLARLAAEVEGAPPSGALAAGLRRFLAEASAWVSAFEGGSPPGEPPEFGGRFAKGSGWDREAVDRAKSAWSELAVLMRSARRTQDFLELVVPFAARLGEARAEDRSTISFDEMLSRFADSLEGSPALRRAVAGRFRHILVDEYQDTSADQARIFRLILGGPDGYRRGSITIVGDPKQSIYGWRQADLASYMREREALAARAEDALCATISVSFRSSRRVIGLVNALGPALFSGTTEHDCAYSPFVPAPDAPPGDMPRLVLVDDTAEDRMSQARVRSAAAGWVAGFLGSEGASPGDWSILMQTGTDSAILLDALQRAGIPFTATVGRDFANRPETGDLKALLSCLLEPRDRESLYHVLRSPFFGVDDATLTRAAEAGLSSWVDPPEGAGEHVLSACGMLRTLRRASLEMPPGDFLLYLLSNTDMVPVVRAMGHEVDRRLGNLQYILDRCLGGMHRSLGSLRDALDDSGGGVVLEEPSTVRSPGRVTVTTMHKAKGLTFGNTIVLPPLSMTSRGTRDPLLIDGDLGLAAFSFGGDDGTPALPALRERESRRRLAESRRLLYVALTRPRNGLVMIARRSMWEGEPGGANLDSLLVSSLRAAEAVSPGLFEVETAPPAPAGWVARVPPAKPEGVAEGTVRRLPGPPEPLFTIPESKEEDSLALGTAVHLLLEKIDFADPRGWLEAALGGMVPPPGVDPARAAGLVLSLFGMELPFDLSGAVILGREYPYQVFGPGGLHARYVDLLAEQDGVLYALDYKTDAIAPGEVPDRAAWYLSKQEGYGQDLAEALGRPVSVWLAFLAPGAAFRVGVFEPPGRPVT